VATSASRAAGGPTSGKRLGKSNPSPVSTA
jgi:hypothetical protein